MHEQTAAPTRIEDIGASVLRSGWFLGLGSISIITLLFLAGWPWWFNRLALTVSTRVVEVSASAPGVHVLGVDLPMHSEIQVFSAHPDGLPPELAALAGGPVSVRLAASRATLQTISLSGQSKLFVSITSDGRTDIGVLDAGSISLALSGTIERIDEDGHRTELANSERPISWDIKPAERYNPARIVLPREAAIAIYNQPIDGFWFRQLRQANDDPRTLQSEILKGQLQLLDTDTKIELQPRELVLLEGGDRFMYRLEVVDEAIEVDLLGVADRISVGPPRPGLPLRLDRDLTPSVLSYLFAQHWLKVLWAIALAVLGALWKARQWALKWQK